MQASLDRHRQHATIKSAKGPHKGYHDILTVDLYLDFTSGMCQSFGGLCLDDKLAPSYIQSICQTFGVTEFPQLVDKKCYALYSFDGWNESIEGLESADTGRRFLHEVWRRENCPNVVRKTILERRSEEMFSTALRLEKQAKEVRQRLQFLGNHFVDWEKQ